MRPPPLCAPFLLALLSSTLAPLAGAQSPPEAPPAVPGDSDAPPPELDSTQADSVTLVSNEVLRGKLGSLRKDSLSFDSDELGELELDWADVTVVRSSRRLVFVDDQLREQIGPAVVNGDVATVRTSTGIVSVPRASLISIVPHDEGELGHWGLRADLGATIRKGNSDTLDLSGAMKLRRQDSLTRLLIEANAAHGEVNGEATVQQTSSALNFDVYLSRAFYVRPLFASAQTDRFKNVQFRGTVGAGGGWTILNTAPISLDLDLGAGYQSTNYESAPAGLEDPNEAGIALLGTRIETELVSGVELDLLWRSFLAVTDMAQTYHEGSVALSVDAHDAVELKVALYYDRVEEPVPDDNGVVPKRNDMRLVASLGVDLW